MPSSQSRVSSRWVDSSGQTARHAHLRHLRQHRAVERRHDGPRARNRAPRAAAPRSPCRSRTYRSPAPSAGAGRTASRAGADRPRPPTSYPDIGACRRARDPSWARARCTWPSEAAAAGLCSKLAKRVCQSGPSSADMRRLTKAQPMGGASLCSLVSSIAYSAGSASGMVASNWATFMIGPFRPPSAARVRPRCWRGRAAGQTRDWPQPAPQRRRHWCRRGHSARRARRSGFVRCRPNRTSWAQPSCPLSNTTDEYR